MDDLTTADTFKVVFTKLAVVHAVVADVWALGPLSRLSEPHKFPLRQQVRPACTLQLFNGCWQLISLFLRCLLITMCVPPPAYQGTCIWTRSQHVLRNVNCFRLRAHTLKVEIQRLGIHRMLCCVIAVLVMRFKMRHMPFWCAETQMSVL
eukprot:917073-Pelagomonas_calceolata.AAC.2